MTRDAEEEVPDIEDLPRPVQKLIDSLHPYQLSSIGLNTGFMGAVNSGYTEPQSYNEAMSSEQSEEWKKAIAKEFNDMHTRKVWEIVKKSQVPDNRRLLGSRWVFKKKNNGVYRARLVAKGYSQIPGVDYTESYAPVISDVTFRILLILMVVYGYTAMVLDVEVAFLHGEMDSEVYMESPQGYEQFTQRDECLVLKKAIYGLVQAARQWYKTFSKFVVEELKFTESKADACLLYKKTAMGNIYFGMYVDDVLLVGPPKAVQTVLNLVKSKYNIKYAPFKEYVGTEVLFDTDRTGCYVYQKGLIKSLEKFDLPTDLRTYSTPAEPLKTLTRSTEDDNNLLDGKSQFTYRSGTGKLLYLLKHSRPEISNSVRELSKNMTIANQDHLRAMYRVIKYVLDTRNIGLKLFPNMKGPNIITAMSDSSYADDKESRFSTTGYIIFLRGAPISWKSKGQRTVAQSSTEAEYLAMSETVQEMVYIKQLLESIGETVELPMKLFIDNAGALFLVKNKSTSQRTKHIDVRHHYMRNLVDEKIIEVDYVPTEENTGDLFTKNLQAEVFKEHAGKLVGTCDNADYIENIIDK
jgi:hypothetical protein